MSQVPEFLTTRPHTWGDNADGHEQDMLFLMQVQFLQTDLELDERLNQVQTVSSYEREWSDAVGRTEETPIAPHPTSHPDQAWPLPFSPCYCLSRAHDPRMSGARVWELKEGEDRAQTHLWSHHWCGTCSPRPHRSRTCRPWWRTDWSVTWWLRWHLTSAAQSGPQQSDLCQGGQKWRLDLQVMQISVVFWQVYTCQVTSVCPGSSIEELKAYLERTRLFLEGENSRLYVKIRNEVAQLLKKRKTQWLARISQF